LLSRLVALYLVPGADEGEYVEVRALYKHVVSNAAGVVELRDKLRERVVETDGFRSAEGLGLME
jgi:hypothetical protein